MRRHSVPSDRVPRDPSSAIYYGRCGLRPVRRTELSGSDLHWRARQPVSAATSPAPIRVLTVRGRHEPARIELAQSAPCGVASEPSPNISPRLDLDGSYPWKHDADREHYLEGFRPRRAWNELAATGPRITAAFPRTIAVPAMQNRRLRRGCRSRPAPAQPRRRNRARLAPTPT